MENVIVQQVEDFCNPNVVSDLSLVGRLWADDEPDEENVEVDAFTEVLSKSQKKKMKKRSKNVQNQYTPRGRNLISDQ
ncbi:unnamed protein product [Lupinus luteus]|uniref:Uncharacterized protein n=1 Tax=Lupinus luteus TaxID=3873 RepID=A0AAV1XJB4_LUPLU